MIIIAIWFQKSPRVALLVVNHFQTPKKRIADVLELWESVGICDDMATRSSSGSGETRSPETTTHAFPTGILGVGTQLLVLMVWPMVWMLESPWGWTYQRVFSPFYFRKFQRQKWERYWRCFVLLLEFHGIADIPVLPTCDVCSEVHIQTLYIRSF